MRIPRLDRRSIRNGVVAVAAMALLYAVVVGVLSGSASHLASQLASTWFLLAPIVLGFGIQVALVTQLRGGGHRSGSVVGAAGAGTSTVGMIACCAHHIADLIPILGASAAATLFYGNRIYFMLAGLAMTLGSIGVMLKRLDDQSQPAPHIERESSVCVPG